MQSGLALYPQMVVENWEGYLSCREASYMHHWRLFQHWAARLDQVISCSLFLKILEGPQEPGRQQLSSVCLLLSVSRVGTSAKSESAFTW